MATLTLVFFQVLLPLALLAWCARTQSRTLAAWTLGVCGVAGYCALIAATGFWGRVAPWYAPFVYLFAVGAITWHRAAWIRALRGWPHSNDDWRNIASVFSFALATCSFALIAIEARPITADHGLDVTTLNLYRELASALVGLLMLGVAIRSTKWGRVALSALFIYAAGTNLRIALTTPQDYLAFADYAVLDIYRSFITGFFADHTAAVIGTIAIGQALIVFLLAMNGWPRHLGYLGAIIFLLAITPLGIGAGFPATILMALCAAEVLHGEREAFLVAEGVQHRPRELRKLHQAGVVRH